MEKAEVENSPLRRKRKRSESTPSKTQIFTTDSDDESVRLTSKSFYGSSKKKYLTPLERRDINNIREDSDTNSSFSIASPQQTSKINLLGKSPKSISKPKPSQKLATSKKLTPKSKKSPTTEPNPGDNIQKDTKTTPVKNDSKKSDKKFFRNSSPGKRVKSGLSVCITKGNRMDIKYKPSGVAKRPRSPRKKLLANKSTPKTYTPGKTLSAPKNISTPQKAQTLAGAETPTRSSQRLKSGTPSKSCTPQKAQTPNRTPRVSTPRRSPRKRVIQKSGEEIMDLSLDLSTEEEDVDSGMGKPTPDFEVRMFESPAKSTPLNGSLRDDLTTSPDSVMLISELESESSPHSSKSSKKLFPIFGKISPKANASPRGSNKNSPRSTPGSSKRLNLLKKATVPKEQMTLDFGQKRIGPTQCEVCGMTYAIADALDEATHRKFHDRMLTALKFPGWKKERVVQKFPDGNRVVMVLQQDKYAAKKVEQIKAIVDEDLGFVVDGRILKNATTFLYISENKVVGCCVAQVIQKAYRVLGVGEEEECEEEEERGDGTSVRRVRGRRPWCCSTTPEPARVGISRIWVLPAHRRLSVATQLLDCVRYNFIMGCPVSLEEIAFSDPTPAGMGFATKYTGTPSFLVYKNIT